MIGALIVVLLSLVGSAAAWRATRPGRVPPPARPRIEFDTPEVVARRAVSALASRDELEVPEARCRILWSAALDAWALVPRDSGPIRLAATHAGVEVLLTARVRALRERSTREVGSWDVRGGRRGGA